MFRLVLVACFVAAVSATCQDLTGANGVSTCASNKAAGLCSNPAYNTLMTQQCPVTCGKCPTTTSSSSVSTTCVDLVKAGGASDCAARAYLCTDPNYKSLMTTQCPRTCGYCTVGKK